MRNIVDVSTFTDPVTVLEDGDPVSAVETQPTIQALSNRSRLLFDALTPALTVAGGSSRSDAVPLAKANTILNATVDNQGVIFTAALRALSGRIWNPTGHPVKLYPIIGETLLEFRNVGVTTPYPVSANDSPVTIPAYGMIEWSSNLVGPGGGGGIPGSPAWTWLAKVSDDFTHLISTTLPPLSVGGDITTSGHVLLTGANPASNTGFGNVITPLHVAKGFAEIGLQTTTPTVRQGLNVSNPRYSGSVVLVDLVTPLTGQGVASPSQYDPGNLAISGHQVFLTALSGTSGGVTTITLSLYDIVAAAAVNLSTIHDNSKVIGFTVFGAQ